MEDSKRDEVPAKKLKYVPPELISLDKNKGAEGGAGCADGSGAAGIGCTAGGAN